MRGLSQKALRRVEQVAPHLRHPLAHEPADLDGAALDVTGGASATGVSVTGSGTKVALTSVTLRGAAVGLSATGGAVVKLNRCTLRDNLGSAAVFNGAGFTITNSVIAGNGTPNGDPVISLGPVPAGAPSTFLNNTVADNKSIAVLCTSTKHPLMGSIFAGNALDSASCMFAACCAGDPLLTPGYRLTPGSPCIDQLAPGMSTMDDVDGKSRPSPVAGKSDCGASEWSP